MEAQRSLTREQASWRLASACAKAPSLKVHLSASCPAGANCPSAKLLPSPVDGRGQHPKPRCQGEEAHAPDSGKGSCGGGAHTSVLTSLFQEETGKTPAPTPIPQRSPTTSSFSASTAHYIFCQPQMGPKLHTIATKPWVRACRAKLQGN